MYLPVLRVRQPLTGGKTYFSQHIAEFLICQDPTYHPAISSLVSCLNTTSPLSHKSLRLESVYIFLHRAFGVISFAPLSSGESQRRLLRKSLMILALKTLARPRPRWVRMVFLFFWGRSSSRKTSSSAMPARNTEPEGSATIIGAPL